MRPKRSSSQRTRVPEARRQIADAPIPSPSAPLVEVLPVMTVHAIVDGLIRVPAGALPPKAMERLWAALTFPNPAYVRVRRLGRAALHLPETITLIEGEPGGTLLLPRGAVGVLRAAAAAAGEEVSFEDRRALLPPVAFELLLDPRPHQERGAAALVRHVQGVVIAPCGAGKSALAMAAVARVAQPALVLVRTRDLVEQWRSGLEAVLGRAAGVIAGGKHVPNIVTVATVQSLGAMSSDKLGELGRQFGAVVVDECHNATAPTDRRVLGHLPARYRFGMTATPERTDGLGGLLDLTIGPAVCRIEHRELIEGGHLVVPRVVPVPTGCSPDVETHAALVAELVADEARNQQIAELAAREAHAGHTVLVLSGRTEHCEALATMLRAKGISAEALIGKATRARRAGLLGRFRSGGLAVLCATSLADEGLDVPRLDRLVLATPARAAGRTIQRLGRLMRPFAGKAQPVLFDLVDEGRIARAQFRARSAAYRTVLGAVPSTQGM